MKKQTPVFPTVEVVLGLAFVAVGCAAHPDYGSRSQVVGTNMPASGPIVGAALATFDSATAGVAGFRLDAFAEPTNLFNGSTPTPPTLSWVANEGSPDPGCLKITAPYSAANQYVDLESPVFPMPLPDWSGKKLHVRVKVDPDSTFTGSPELYVKTGTLYVFYPMTFGSTAKSSDWQEVILPLVSPAPVPPATSGADPTQVISYGIHPTPGSSPSAPPTPVTFFVDSFSIE